MDRSFLWLASVVLLVGTSSALLAQEATGQIICQHTTDPTYSWKLDIGVGGTANEFKFVPQNASMKDANGEYAGSCTQEECTAEKPTTTGDTTYRTVLRVDRLAGVAQITQYQDNGDVWSKWQATCEQQDGSSDQ